MTGFKRITYTRSEISALTGYSPSDIGLIAKALKFTRKEDFIQSERDAIVEFADFAKTQKITIQQAIAQFEPNQPREAPRNAEERNTSEDLDTATLDTINRSVGNAGQNVIETFRQQKQTAIAEICAALKQEVDSFPFELAIAVMEMIESLPLAQPVFEFENYDGQQLRQELQEQFGVLEVSPAERFRQKLQAQQRKYLPSDF